MSEPSKPKVSRRTFLKRTAIVTGVGAAAAAAGSYWLGGSSRVSRSAGKKVIVSGEELIDQRWVNTPIVEVESIQVVR